MDGELTGPQHTRALEGQVEKDHLDGLEVAHRDGTEADKIIGAQRYRKQTPQPEGGAQSRSPPNRFQGCKGSRVQGLAFDAFFFLNP